MKAKIVLLGEYDSSSFFKLYILPSTSSSSSSNNNNSNNNATMVTTMDYLCIEDLYYLFFCQHKQQHIYSLFQHIYQLYPHHFYHDSKLKKGYIAKHHVESLAKQLQLFALAELCSLSHDELLNNVADPLFAITNALLLRPVTPKCMEVDLDWSLLPHHLIFSYFSSPPPSSSSAIATNNNISDSSLQSKHTNHHTTTKNDHSWSYHFLPISSHLMKRTLKAQKQQHAIIECRQRQLYRKKRKRTSPSSSLCSSPPPTSLSCSSSISSSSSFSSSSNTIIINPSSSNTLLQHDPPPPLPPLINHHSPIKKQKLSSSSSSSFSNSSFNNNLDLLATQATKMKGLPLSPEISPQPPVLSLPPISSNVSFHSSPLIQSISLPSLRNVLSDI
ncbi:unnamed protein product [Cunninghamella echinulata]